VILFYFQLIVLCAQFCDKYQDILWS